MYTVGSIEEFQNTLRTGDERIVRPVNIHMRPGDGVAADKRTIVATHLNMGEMQSFGAKKVMHGEWTIEVKRVSTRK